MNSFGVSEIMEVDGTWLTILGVSAGILILTVGSNRCIKAIKPKA